MLHRYNNIFLKLVKSHDDLLGLLAYGVYKNKKIEYIKKYREKHGIDPDDTVLDEFHKISTLETSIQQYKHTANTTLNNWSLNLIKVNIDKFRLLTHEEQKILLKKIKPTFSEYIIAGIIGNLAFIAFIIILFLVIKVINSNYPNQLLEMLLQLLGLK